MSLPILPQLTNDDKVNIDLLYRWLQQLSLSFANAAGTAIDPSIGEGGDAALTITEAPTGITYTPTSSRAVDGTLFGAIDVTFVKPDRAVCVVIYYNEKGIANPRQSFAFSSPVTLINLKVGTQYDLQLAGQAANGNVSSILSPMVTVTIPFAIALVLGSQTVEANTDCIEPFIVQGPRGPIGQQGQQGSPGFDVDESVFEPITLVRDLPTVGRIPTVLDNLGVFALTTSAQLAAVINNETGTGLLVFNTAPTLLTPVTVNTSGAGVAVIGEYAGGSAYAALGLAGAVGSTTYNLTSSLSDTNLYMNCPAGQFIIVRQGNSATTEITLGDGYIKLAQGTLKLITTGSSPITGSATLVAGTKAVLSDAIVANSQVLLTRKTTGGTIGSAITYTLQTSAPKGFTINSDNPLDTSTFTWVILEGF